MLEGIPSKVYHECDILGRDSRGSHMLSVATVYQKNLNYFQTRILQPGGLLETTEVKYTSNFQYYFRKVVFLSAEGHLLPFS